MRLISANALIELANSRKDGTVDANDIARFPTIEAEPVRNGKWKEHYSNGVWYYDCPFCDDGYATNERQERPENYCSNCGAKLCGAEADDR